MSNDRYAVFIDGQNLSNVFSELRPGRRIDYVKLLAFLKQLVPEGEFMGAYYYCIDFTEVNSSGVRAPEKQCASWSSFLRYLRSTGFVPCVKPANRVGNGNGGNIIKGNQDVEIAVDVTTLSATQRVNHIILITSDQDFTYLIDTIRRLPYAVQTTLICKGFSAGRLKKAASRVIFLEDVADKILERQRSES
ncbi:MAG: NYN domain-containing protein [Patescibacteria group bacterium]